MWQLPLLLDICRTQENGNTWPSKMRVLSCHVQSEGCRHWQSFSTGSRYIKACFGITSTSHRTLAHILPSKLATGWFPSIGYHVYLPDIGSASQLLDIGVLDLYDYAQDYTCASIASDITFFRKILTMYI